MYENLKKDDLYFYVALSFVPRIGNINAKTLISYCGSAEEVFKMSRSRLLKIPGIGPKTVKAVKDFNEFEKVDEELAFIEKNQIQLLTYHDKAYPYRLKQCADSPILLYFKGEADLNASKVISIVGTRNATVYGRDFTEKLVADLSKHNVLILSGLAYGIDITAHKAALKHQMTTVGVLGHGLHTIYPGQHRETADKMTQQGGLLTEFHSNSRFDKENFPKRNRIVAGMSDAVIVVETKKHGGAMITAEIANSYSRDVFALPGNIDREYSVGCNHLIKTNKAALIESAKDVEYLMGWESKPNQSPPQQALFVELEGQEKQIFEALKTQGEMHIDQLSLSIGLTVSETAASLLNLEFSGVVKSFPGKKYRVIS